MSTRETLIKELKAIVDISSTNFKNAGTFYYNGAHDLILKEGTIYESQTFTTEERAHVDNMLRVLDFTPQYKDCYYNAQCLSIMDASDLIKYSEGFCMCGGIPFAAMHGWNTINGKLIDITYKTNSKGRLEINRYSGNMIMGTFPESFCYYGVDIPKSLITSRMDLIGELATILDDYPRKFPIYKCSLEDSANLSYEQLINL